MVGKIKHVRHKLHQDAVKINAGTEKKSLCLGNDMEKAPVLPVNITVTPSTRLNSDKSPREVKVSVHFHAELLTVHV